MNVGNEETRASIVIDGEEVTDKTQSTVPSQDEACITELYKDTKLEMVSSCSCFNNTELYFPNVGVITLSYTCISYLYLCEKWHTITKKNYNRRSLKLVTKLDIAVMLSLYFRTISYWTNVYVLHGPIGDLKREGLKDAHSIYMYLVFTDRNPILMLLIGLVLAMSSCMK